MGVFLTEKQACLLPTSRPPPEDHSQIPTAAESITTPNSPLQHALHITIHTYKSIAPFRSTEVHHHSHHA